jgi:hypothetical protein
VSGLGDCSHPLRKKQFKRQQSEVFHGLEEVIERKPSLAQPYLTMNLKVVSIPLKM